MQNDVHDGLDIGIFMDAVPFLTLSTIKGQLETRLNNLADNMFKAPSELVNGEQRQERLPKSAFEGLTSRSVVKSTRRQSQAQSQLDVFNDGTESKHGLRKNQASNAFHKLGTRMIYIPFQFKHFFFLFFSYVS